ncbi:unnamed protein product [Strongylus vulgaris]|uniref:Proteasome activator complex subunit 4 C-terminal domain-containing protein n=1 Tax=Strongylus vulgaris TaxID=40348 RepID=A0A3P7I9Z5_STRVU|nr:unnamed protein product [Strongylus vulgaris]
MNNDLKSLPKRFQLESIDVWLKRFEKKIDVLASTDNSLTSVALKENPTQRSSPSIKEIASKLLSSPPDRDNRDNSAEPQIYLRTLLEFLLQYYDDCMTCLTPGIISLFPMLIEYANEDENESNESFKDIDIRNNASSLVHEYMSSLLVNARFAESFPDVVIRTFHRTGLWRVRVSVLKYLQVLVFSNIYILERCSVPTKVIQLLFEALKDRQVEVRLEASRCLLTLIFCDYVKIDKFLQEKIDSYFKSTHRCTLHGAVLAMGAVVMAHPFSTPSYLIPMLKSLCAITSHSAELQASSNKLN